MLVTNRNQVDGRYQGMKSRAGLEKTTHGMLELVFGAVWLFAKGCWVPAERALRLTAPVAHADVCTGIRTRDSMDIKVYP